MKQFIVVSYDISDDKRRLRVMKALQDFGSRVQYSVFECNLESGQIAKLRQRLKPLARDRQDSVRIYHLSADDVARIEVIGSGAVSQDRAFYYH